MLLDLPRTYQELDKAIHNEVWFRQGHNGSGVHGEVDGEVLETIKKGLNVVVELIKFAIPILVAALSPVITIWLTHRKERKVARDRYNEKRANDFLSICADYMSIAKSLLHVYDDNADEKIAASTAGIRPSESKLRLLSYFPLNGTMRKRLDTLSMEIEQATHMCARTSEELRLFKNQFGSDDYRTQEKKTLTIELAKRVQALHINLETLFIEREDELRKEWLR